MYKLVVLLSAVAVANCLLCEVYNDYWLEQEFERLKPVTAKMWDGYHTRGFKVRDVAERKQMFMEAAKFVNEHNSAGERSFCLKPNKFATISDEEFKVLLGARVPVNASEGDHYVPQNIPKSALPASVHYDSGPVEDQGQCGDCWAFAASHVLTATLKLSGNYPVEFSEQEICDCVTECYGCNGGWSDKVYTYFVNNPANLDYGDTPYNFQGNSIPAYPRPYDARQGQCQAVPTIARVTKGFSWAPKNSETQLMEVLGKKPTTIYFDVENSSFRYYDHGVYDNTDPSCNADHINHAMSLVGYNTGTDGDYWEVKNSWGADWGLSGYIHIKRDSARCGPCGLCSYPLYPVVPT